jgi:hypothetical protein
LYIIKKYTNFVGQTILMRKLFLSILLLGSLFSYGQKLPSTNLYLFDLQLEGDHFSLKNPKWLNQFNPKGYNNQPFFMSDDEIYVSVQMPWDTTQTDIYCMNIATNEFYPITSTPESEYSPKRVTGTNDFSVVRVDANAEKTQRLWRFPMERTGKGSEVFKYYQSVGYYHWNSAENVLMFMVGKPNFMQSTKLGSENTIRYSYEPGRCFYPVGDKVAYIEKTTDSDWLIKLLDPATSQSSTVVGTLNNSEDFVVLKDGTYIMGKGSGLYKFHPKTDSDWVQFADLRMYNIKKIERMAVNSYGKLVMVTK